MRSLWLRFWYFVVRPEYVCRRCGGACVFSGGVCWGCCKVHP